MTSFELSANDPNAQPQDPQKRRLFASKRLAKILVTDEVMLSRLNASVLPSGFNEKMVKPYIGFIKAVASGEQPPLRQPDIAALKAHDPSQAQINLGTVPRDQAPFMPPTKE